MLFKTIRSQIAIYISLLVFAGMFVIAFISILSCHNSLLSSISNINRQKFDSLVDLVRNMDGCDSKESKIDKKELFEWMDKNGACKVFFIEKSGNSQEFGYCLSDKEVLSDVTRDLDTLNSTYSKIIGSSLFLPFVTDGGRYIVVSGPLGSGSSCLFTSIAAVWFFDPDNYSFGWIEKVLLFYIISNTLLLSLLGVYQIGNITSKPLKKILKRAESIKNLGNVTFDSTGSDFDKLSSAIVYLVDDLTLNRNKLQSTITALEEANFSLKLMQAEIIRAEKMASIGRLSAGLAHEIGNPVGIIGGYLEMLRQRDVEDSDRIDFASRAESELKRIDSIIRELLNYARPKDNLKTIVSVHGIIIDVVETYSGSKVIGNIIVDMDLSAEYDMVLANSDQMRQVFVNLMINASDAISVSDNIESGNLVISTSNTFRIDGVASGLVITFIDNGCGLTEKDIDYIFDPFFTTKSPNHGTGLGLSVSQMIIEDIGGTIKALRCKAGGTEMRITIPLICKGIS